MATLRNSRGGSIPSVLEAVEVCVDAGAPGITVHPRADARHITPADVHDDRAHARAAARDVEFNIEGDPRPDLLAMVARCGPHQCTLVPVEPGEITSQAGWPADTPTASFAAVVQDLQQRGVRVSLFVDPGPRAVDWAASVGAERVELYTEPFARAFKAGPAGSRPELPPATSAAAAAAHDRGLGVNAGHDLDLDNLTLFRTLPHLDEVSIGHALISHALFVGLERAVREYLEACRL